MDQDAPSTVSCFDAHQQVSTTPSIVVARYEDAPTLIALSLSEAIDSRERLRFGELSPRAQLRRSWLPARHRIFYRGRL